jgi:hypothetical protein
MGKSNWGRALTAPLDMFPSVFGVSKAIMTIQIRHEGECDEERRDKGGRFS